MFNIEENISKKSKIDDNILSIPGMSGKKFRNLLNNLGSINNITYLEVGTWKGSTLSSFLYKNEDIKKVYTIDNFSELNDYRFNGKSVKQELLDNIKKYDINNKVEFLEGDFFKSKDKIKNKINIFFYDGEHTYETQYNCLNYIFDKLFDEFLFIVDDFRFDKVRNGTLDSLKNNKDIEIIYQKEILPNISEDPDWWHGMFVAHIKKYKINYVFN